MKLRCADPPPEGKSYGIMTSSTPVYIYIYIKRQVHAIAPTIRDWLLILHHCIIHEPAIHAKVRMSAQSHFVWIMDRRERSWLCRNFSLVYHIRNTCSNLNGAYQGRNPLILAKTILTPYWPGCNHNLMCVSFSQWDQMILLLQLTRKLTCFLPLLKSAHVYINPKG